MLRLNGISGESLREMMLLTRSGVTIVRGRVGQLRRLGDRSARDGLRFRDDTDLDRVGGKGLAGNRR